MSEFFVDNEPPMFYGRPIRPRLREISKEQRELIHEARLQDLENIRTATIYAIIPLVLLSFGGGYVLASVMLRPLENLNTEIKNKELGNLKEEIIFADTGDEISQLVKSFNRMANRLNKAFEAQKQFVENASHEIKSPLAAIQANIDTLLDEKELSMNDREKLLVSAKDRIAEMNLLTEDLLLLSWVGSRQDIDMEKIDIKRPIFSVISSLKLLADKQSIEINFDTDEEIYFRCNRVLIERAISNIIENSIKYSKGNLINISISKESETFSITIEDNGNGIDKKEGENIFKRFYRVDRGRSRKEGGNGLGLAITKDIVEMHNGNVYLDASYKRGAKFVIVLPIVS